MYSINFQKMRKIAFFFCSYSISLFIISIFLLYSFCFLLQTISCSFLTIVNFSISFFISFSSLNISGKESYLPHFLKINTIHRILNLIFKTIKSEFEEKDKEKNNNKKET